jgi:UDP-N-acetylglucosamine pyrophosphorylase
MAGWAKDTGEGSIYTPEGLNKLITIVSPGHFYSFMSIVSDYTLGFLLERGVKRLIVSSNDNLLSTVDPAILALHIKKACGTTEVVPRLYDAGGAPVIIDERVEILEDFSFPDKETCGKRPSLTP